MKTSALFDEKTANDFYEERYQDGYMDEWPDWKKNRIIELIRSTKLHPTGIALDFGCGNGVFTEVLKRALPQWTVYGCDISETALVNGRKRFPECKFILFSDIEKQGLKFDFVFSHHVLEHVYDLETILKETAGVMAPAGYMMHVLPCGNAGSFEHILASSLKDGINPAIGNRFFYEDIGHLRRLKSIELDELVARFAFTPVSAWFANQQWGALDWMCEYPDEFISTELTPLNRAKDNQSEQKLLSLREQIFRLKKARKLAKEGLKHQVKTRLVSLKSNPLGVFSLLPGILADQKLVAEGKAFEERLANEWQLNSQNPAGSEMYLLYQKSAQQ